MTWIINGHSLWPVQAWVPNSASVTVHPRLACLRLYNRIISRIIGGEDGCSALKMDTCAEKVDYKLNT